MKAYMAYEGKFFSNRHSQNHTDYRNLVDMPCYTVLRFIVCTLCTHHYMTKRDRKVWKYIYITIFTKLYALPPYLTMFLICDTLPFINYFKWL